MAVIYLVICHGIYHKFLEDFSVVINHGGKPQGLLENVGLFALLLTMMSIIPCEEIISGLAGVYPKILLPAAG
ncbi:MAG: hypothetical protein NZ901_02440 [Geminocystis sp.]|nr:hypothetical protein [Geminocystis sp.]HIK38706.1 hypothetical protein [Geminocystis sp. M7585_C2015_104]MCS7147029.1 hypothetical protein [Geminocystis sp.]MCX8077341.1 hypothetical protein [Geminocystis sp.]MDW8115853.1 hypothetical protein [Geminocystis sp.]